MSDLGRGMGGAADEDRLPWLEPVEDEGGDEGVSAGRLVAGLVVALVALGLIVGGVYWLKQRADGSAGAKGDPTLIAAQPGAYKVKPTEPGGMDVKGQGDSSYAASEGADPDGKIDLSAIPEAPIARDTGKPAPQQAAAPTAAPAKPAEVAKAVPTPTPVKTVPLPASKPAPAPAVKPEVAKAAPVKAEPKPAPLKEEKAAAPSSGGAQIQLGAFSSEAKANEAWKSLSGRFGYLGALGKSIVPVTSNGKTVYRLRASAGGQASSICSKLKIAGEACVVVG
ncbi:SPOR domain-containing protein [Sphingomonas oligoaromativorans]|uniref:SPOR domain-containing protein n=1 Tax=Sphingomonas oligoaromativorans TaxID=575322 RepID=UPI001421D3AA|nr:SPOR domain-containing protein [Sphingomonas oligoaromativorans]NIJ33830.1 cell division septation protein DedD [Sphingomonas oligoaromativorans]